MIVLDTDVFTHFTWGHANVLRHYKALPTGEPTAITAVTRAEVIRGKTDGLLKAADERELLLAARRFQEAEVALALFLLLHVDAAAARHFETLRKRKKQGKMERADMLIACIALANDALLVTRNTKDFDEVTGLRLANWVDD